jgi:hypothetical protein
MHFCEGKAELFPLGEKVFNVIKSAIREYSLFFWRSINFTFFSRASLKSSNGNGESDHP